MRLANCWTEHALTWTHRQNCEDHVVHILQCVQHHTARMLGKKLRPMQMDESVISRVLDYLTGRPQCVPLQGCGN